MTTRNLIVTILKRIPYRDRNHLETVHSLLDKVILSAAFVVRASDVVFNVRPRLLTDLILVKIVKKECSDEIFTCSAVAS